MAGRPTFNPRGAIGGKSLMATTVGITATSEAVDRNIMAVGLGRVTVPQSFPVFVTPPSGATIKAIRLTLGTLMGHAASSNKAWTFNISNTSANVCLSKYGATLSGVTLKATSFRTMLMNGGNSTLTAGAVLKLRASVSGSPDPIPNLVVHVEWAPVNNV